MLVVDSTEVFIAPAVVQFSRQNFVNPPYIVQFQKWKKMMDLFSSTFGSFNITCDILPNLDENDTLFLYREQNKQ